MSDEQTSIVEFPFTQGQNEGTERTVLPIGQFSALQNARFRKQNLLGKRNGYTSVNSLDQNGVALGNGAGRLACLGPEFCVVDDRYYRRNLTQGAWSLSAVATGAQARRLPNRFPEFMPSPVLEMTTQESLTAASDAEASMAYAIGYIWTAESRAISGAGWVIHVDAIDPVTSDVVRSWDIEHPTAVNTDSPHVKLLVTLYGTLVLLTDRFTVGAKTGLTWYLLSSLSGGFGTSTTIGCVESAVNYCTNGALIDHIVMARVETGSLATVRISYLNIITGAHVNDSTYAVGGNKTGLSIFQGSFQNLVRIGWTDATGPAAIVQTRSSTMVLVGTSDMSALIAGSATPIMFAETSLGTVSAIATNSTNSVMNQAAVDTAGSFVAFSTSVQLNCHALTWPFTIEGRVYIWVRYLSGESLGVASLLRVALGSEYSSAITPGVWPIQATVDNRDIDAPLAQRTAGPPFSLPIATPLGYLSVINYTRETYVGSGSVTFRRRGYMLVPVQHRSGGVRYSASSVTPCGGRQFVASAQPMWVDRISAYEAGFIQAPLNVSATPAAGGSLTPSAQYSWTCIFQSADSDVIERSGPALLVTVTLGALEDRCTVVWTTHELGARRQITGRIYRTEANGSVFYFVGSFDATAGAGTTGSVSFIDTTADQDIIQNEALYTQIGQEQAASNVPACSFANTGGNRLWVGGGFTGNIVTASKQFMPHIIPEFVDDDAWRVTLPGNCTGAAWLDSQVLFTQEGIYVISGDGPDPAGVGFFSLSRLPFNVGCIDWRSVVVSDIGIFFQSPRGLYLLTRGFGSIVPMDQVIDTLTTYPVITAARSDFSSSGGADSSEQLVQWCALADEEASEGVVITFDVSYKAFYVDTFRADFPPCFLSGWSGDSVQAPAVMTIGPNGSGRWHPFRVADTSFDDEGLNIEMLAETGDMRPFGTFGHGVVPRSGVLAVLRSACTLGVTKTTDKGALATSRVYSSSGLGANIYLAIEQGGHEQRDVTSLRIQLTESSTVEGASFVGVVIEVANSKQNFKLLPTADRII